MPDRCASCHGDGFVGCPACNGEEVRKPVRIGVIRSWPEGMADRVEHVWRDLIGFTIDYKLYDLQRVLAEFGFELNVHERAAPLPQKAQLIQEDE